MPVIRTFKKNTCKNIKENACNKTNIEKWEHWREMPVMRTLKKNACYIIRKIKRNACIKHLKEMPVIKTFKKNACKKNILKNAWYTCNMNIKETNFQTDVCIVKR